MDRAKPRFFTANVISDYKNDDELFNRFDFVLNIGDGGVFIETSRPLNIGSEIEIILTIIGEPDPIHVRGTVCWTRNNLLFNGQRKGMGIKFEVSQPGLASKISQIKALECRPRAGGLDK